jgi:hypothetical protein
MGTRQASLSIYSLRGKGWGGSQPNLKDHFAVGWLADWTDMGLLPPRPSNLPGSTLPHHGSGSRPSWARIWAFSVQRRASHCPHSWPLAWGLLQGPGALLPTWGVVWRSAQSFWG